MTIWEMQTGFQADASLLGDYQAMDKTELANGYCDADDIAMQAEIDGDVAKFEEYETIRCAYHSALMLRYWYKIFQWQSNSATLNLPATDFVEWLRMGLYVAFYYKAWRYEFKAVVKEGKFIQYSIDKKGDKIINPYYYKIDSCAPDKIINRCCGSIRGREFQFHNKDKRKVNTQTYSLDTMVDDDGDYALDALGAYTYDRRIYTEGAYGLIQMLLERGESLEAIIVDSIAYHDNYRVEKEVTISERVDEETGEEFDHKEVSYYGKFDSRKIVKHLNSIGEDFIYEFCETYEVTETIGEALLKSLKSLSNAKLYTLIEKTLEEIKQSPTLLDFIK